MLKTPENENAQKMFEYERKIEKINKELINGQPNQIIDDVNGLKIIQEYKSKDGFSTRPVPLTNFLIDVVEYIVSEEIAKYKCILKNKLINYTEEKIIDSSCFKSIKDFKKMLCSKGVQFSYYGTESTLEYFKMYIHENCKKMTKGVDRNGFTFDKNNELVFFDSENNINSEGEESKDITFVDNSTKLKSKILSNDEIMKEEFEKIGKSLFNFNNKICGVATISYICACLLNFHLKEGDLKIPHLAAIGEAGSGKSSLVEKLILPILGMNNSALGCDAVTKYTAYEVAMSSNVFPVVLDEFKPYMLSMKQLKMLSSILRSAYDGHGFRRGRGSNAESLEWFWHAPIVLVGEANTNETAILDRIIEINFNKKSHNKNTFSHFKNLSANKKLLGKLGKSLLMEVFNVDDICEKIEKRFSEVDLNINSRQLEGVVLLEQCFVELFDRLSIKLYDNKEKIWEVIGIKKDEILNILTAEKEVKTKTAVENILELYNDLGNLVRGWHYEIKDDMFILNVKDTYKYITKHVKEYSLEHVELLDMNQFTKALRNSQYFVRYANKRLRRAYDAVAGTDEKNQCATVTKKCFILDLTKLKKELDFTNLVHYELEDDEEMKKEKLPC